MDSAASVVELAEDELAVQSGLAKEAALLFQSGKYAECLGILNQLLQKKEEEDRKVLHNIATVEYFQGGCSDPKRLIEALENIKKRSEELGRASQECLEVDSNTGSKTTAGISGSINVENQISSEPVVGSDEFDTSVAIFNIAVVWFHLHEYSKSFSYLDMLYRNIVPIDEGIALRICLLLLDVALLSDHASRSADVITYMEKAFCASNSTVGDVFHSDSLISSNTLENSLNRTLSDEVLEDDLLSLDIPTQNPQRPSGISSNDLPKSEALDSISAVDLKLKLHLYKVRFLLLTRNLKAAKREVKMAMNTARGIDYSTALYLKSQIEYARGNHRKAIKQLMASSNNRSETGFSSMYYNNLGCIYYRLAKIHTSGVFFTKALKEKPPKIGLSSQDDKSLFIMYNCGVQSLACGMPFQAARCFKAASRVFYNRPILWLRIAECCVMALQKGLIEASDDIKVHVIGKGKWRNLALGNNNGVAKNGQVEKQPDLSMAIARQCLVNSLHLLDSFEGKNSNSEEIESLETLTNGDVKASSSLQNSVPDYEEIRVKENQTVKQAALADLAYVELELENPLKALSTAKSLLKLPECSRIYKFLATMYVAEALCLLNQPKEAAEYLMMYMSSGNNSVELPFSQEDGVSDVFSSPEEARGVIFANFAANFALMGDFEQAQHFVMKALLDLPNSTQAVITSIYVDLKRGKTREAVAKLKQHGGVRFLPGRVTSDGSS